MKRQAIEGEAAVVRAWPRVALAMTALIGLGYWFDVTENNGMSRTMYVGFGFAMLVIWVLIGVYHLSFGKPIDRDTGSE